MLADPEHETAELLKCLGLSTEHLPLALEAFDTDSQNGAIARRGDVFDLSAEAWTEVDRVFDQLGIGVKEGMAVEEFCDLIVNRKC